MKKTLLVLGMVFTIAVGAIGILELQTRSRVKAEVLALYQRKLNITPSVVRISKRSWTQAHYDMVVTYKNHEYTAQYSPGGDISIQIPEDAGL